MTYLVIGASGAQGGAVAARLAAQGHRVRGYGRSGRVPYGVEPFLGDLGDPAALKAALAGVRRVSLTLPMVFGAATVAAYAAALAEALVGASVERVVFNLANRVPERASGVAAFTTRRAAVETLTAAGVPLVVLRPPVYLDNLGAPWVRGPLLSEGVLRYPLPAELAVGWLSHHDLGVLTAAALTRDGLEGARLDLGGPEALTGPELAALFGARYEAQDPAAFTAALDALTSGTAGDGISVGAAVGDTYRWAASDPGFYLPDPGVAERLGVKLTPAGEWVAAQPWARR
ncbi:NmrA family NAD(P)-binding protein [Nonomuraea sp. NBC_01738]|uniref:SDR family oxidoreductase n=1 Tax=Nonomuraea sp. NBC_01738 TaxID=2976003 RepID=UPI002E108008|nr:NmrA family NAD(P)-binding protein [Nonomuraea sp. NBC_01738]